MTTTIENEPSALALDIFWAAGESGAPEVARHVEKCARCRAYLAAHQRAALSAPPLPPAVQPRGRRRVWPLLAAAAAVGVVGFAIAMHRSEEQDGYVGLKGAPAVQVLVHRDAITRVWDGRAAVRPGDSLALRVACENLQHVAIASPGPAGWLRLSDSACPAPGSPLPLTLRVDEAPGPERLSVVFSGEPLDDDALRGALGEGRRDARVWVAGFVLPKEIGRDP